MLWQQCGSRFVVLPCWIASHNANRASRHHLPKHRSSQTRLLEMKPRDLESFRLSLSLSTIKRAGNVNEATPLPALLSRANRVFDSLPAKPWKSMRTLPSLPSPSAPIFSESSSLESDRQTRQTKQEQPKRVLINLLWVIILSIPALFSRNPETRDNMRTASKQQPTVHSSVNRRVHQSTSQLYSVYVAVFLHRCLVWLRVRKVARTTKSSSKELITAEILAM